MNGFWKSKLATGRIFAAMTLAALLSACGGGGGGSGTPVVGPPDGGTPVPVASLSVASSSATLPNDGTQTSTVTVTALDASNVAIKNVAVSFAADSGTISPLATQTDDKGEIKATLGIGDNKAKRTITITANAGGVIKTATVSVVDSTTTAPTATELALSLDKFTVSNSGTDTVAVSVTAKGEGGRVMQGIPISLDVDGGASYVPSGAVTNASGLWTAVVSIGGSKANRVINVKASSGALAKTDSFQVTGSRLVVSSFSPNVAAGAASTIEYRVSDVNNSPMKDVDVTVSGAGLAAGSGKTDFNGLFVYRYTAPSSAGTVAINATAAGVSNQQIIVVGSATIPPASLTVTSIPVPVSATPDVLKVNTDSTNNLSQIKALFLSANNVPVPNVRVRFDFDGNVSPNGSLTSGDSLVFSDARGVAVTNYKAGRAASPTNGVVVRACWDYNDFAVGTCPNSNTVKLTVVEEGLAVTIGTDDTLNDGPTGLTYVKRFVVQVANAAGGPVGSQQVTPKVTLLGYLKGDYAWNGTAWTAGRGGFGTGGVRQLSVLSCANEDASRNGALEVGEDLNGNGVLEPRIGDVTVTMEGGVDKTNASGQVVLLIDYPKSHAGWVAIEISVSADVRSPPATWTGLLPIDASVIKREVPPPAFRFSPYKVGASGSCAVDD